MAVKKKPVETTARQGYAWQGFILPPLIEQAWATVDGATNTATATTTATATANMTSFLDRFTFPFFEEE